MKATFDVKETVISLTGIIDAESWGVYCGEKEVREEILSAIGVGKKFGRITVTVEEIIDSADEEVESEIVKAPF